MSWLTAAIRSLTNRPKRTRTDELSADILRSLAGLDTQALSARYPDARWGKYANLQEFVPFHVKLCALGGLIGAAPAHILDVGCGSGIFLRCARHFGHDGIGIDVEDPFLADMAAALGVPRLVAPVRKFQPLAVEGRFDVVTALNTYFDREIGPSGRTKAFWGCAEWNFFLTDVRQRLTPQGRVYLRLNVGPNRKLGIDYYDEHVHRAMQHGHVQRVNYLFDRAGLDLAIDNLKQAQTTPRATVGMCSP